MRYSEFCDKAGGLGTCNLNIWGGSLCKGPPHFQALELWAPMGTCLEQYDNMYFTFPSFYPFFPPLSLFSFSLLPSSRSPLCLLSSGPITLEELSEIRLYCVRAPEAPIRWVVWFNNLVSTQSSQACQEICLWVLLHVCTTSWSNVKVLHIVLH